jgi:hypothetical protein
LQGTFSMDHCSFQRDSSLQSGLHLQIIGQAMVQVSILSMRTGHFKFCYRIE